LTLSINQIVLLVFVGIASTMAVGSVSSFQFAFNLQSVPLAIIGVSYSVAAFPTLSYLHAKKDHFSNNPRMGMMLSLLAKKDPKEMEEIKQRARQIIENPDQF